MWVAGIAFAFWLLVIIFQLLFGVTSMECWNVGALDTMKSVKSDLNSLTAGGGVKKRTVVMGGCVDSIMFINKDNLGDLDKIPGIVDCPSSYSAYIIALPYYKETESGWRVWKWFEDGVVEEVEKWYNKNVRAFKPTCEIMNCDNCYFNGAPITLEGSRDEGKTKTYCLTMNRGGGDGKLYNIDVKEGKCK